MLLRSFSRLLVDTSFFPLIWKFLSWISLIICFSLNIPSKILKTKFTAKCSYCRKLFSFFKCLNNLAPLSSGTVVKRWKKRSKVVHYWFWSLGWIWLKELILSALLLTLPDYVKLLQSNKMRFWLHWKWDLGLWSVMQGSHLSTFHRKCLKISSEPDTILEKCESTKEMCIYQTWAGPSYNYNPHTVHLKTAWIICILQQHIPL